MTVTARQQARRELDRAVVQRYFAQQYGAPAVAAIERSVKHIQVPLPTRTTTISFRQVLGERDGFACLGDRLTVCVPPFREREGPAQPPGGDADGRPGWWTAETVRSRLIEAINTYERMPVDGIRPAQPGAAWPEPVREVIEAYGWSEIVARVYPTATEIGRADKALPWLALITDIDQRRAVLGVAAGLNLRAIGEKLGCLHTHARALQRRGLEQIAAALNSGGR